MGSGSDTPVPPGKESVWDYPRPPRLEPASRHVRVELAGEVLADTARAFRVLETSHPPVYYLPPEDCALEFLAASARHSFCEWKGQASYYDARVGDTHVPDIAWYYPRPTPPFEQIQRYLAFYPSKVDLATVNGETVQSQAGDFYGGWITGEIAGPFKGGPGTAGW